MDQMHQHRDGIKTSLQEAKVCVCVCVAPPAGCVLELRKRWRPAVPSAVSAELPGQTAGGHREDSGEGEQQREVHQQPAGPPDPGVPQRSGQTQRGNESHFSVPSRRLLSSALPLLKSDLCSPPGKRAPPAGQRGSDGQNSRAG